MATIDARPGALEELAADVPGDRPIVLLNLLRFADEVEIDGERMTGRAAYERYVYQIERAIVAVGGRPIFRGAARTTLIGPPDERWDEVVLVHYPNKEAFERLVASERYRSSARLRLSALEDARLIAISAPQSIGRWKWALYSLGVRIRRS